MNNASITFESSLLMIVCSILLQITWVDGFQVLFTSGPQNAHVIVDFDLEYLLPQIRALLY